MLSTAKSALGQSFNIPPPPLTEQNLPSQSSRIHLITGGYTGVGLELAKILYSCNATVYIAGRSPDKAQGGLAAIRDASPNSKGKVEFLKLDLADLSTIKESVDAFLSKESRLHVLTNNAGVMFPPVGSKTAQGYEQQIGTNCLGPFLLTQLLRPVLEETARTEPEGAVRVTWAGSLAVDLMSPKGGIRFEDNGAAGEKGAGAAGGPKVLGRQGDYGQSKAGNLLLANEVSKRWGPGSGVVQLAWNPGNLKTELQRHTAGSAMMNWMLHPARFGAYTELYAACGEGITKKDDGKFIVPWGRVGTNRADVLEGIRGKSEGGLGTAERFYDWCEGATREFMHSETSAPTARL